MGVMAGKDASTPEMEAVLEAAGVDVIPTTTPRPQVANNTRALTEKARASSQLTVDVAQPPAVAATSGALRALGGSLATAPHAPMAQGVWAQHIRRESLPEVARHMGPPRRLSEAPQMASSQVISVKRRPGDTIGSTFDKKATCPQSSRFSRAEST